jgi:hypothetical protein
VTAIVHMTPVVKPSASTLNSAIYSTISSNHNGVYDLRSNNLCYN